MKFGDVVVYVSKSPDGSFRRVNAVVTASAVQSPNAKAPYALRDAKGPLLPGEYLDLLFPREFPAGVAPRARDVDSLFSRSIMTSPWKDGATTGWLPTSATKLRAFLFANFKNETGNETPEECAMRLLAKMRQLTGRPQTSGSRAK